MILSQLKPAPGSRHARKRVGRGIGSGMGKTSTRGHKGQNARSGGGVRPGFEGGQNPLYRRIPKRGFHNPFRKTYAIVNVGQLDQFPEHTVVTPELLLQAGIIRKQCDGVKVLGDGQCTVALHVQAHHFSESAILKLQSTGSKIEVIA
ncbi:MAG: 50S ribosomal protein L15 [Paenibacillaceae bacterium]|nr:50S ribosomal protein L15 [Paenibacillaceae bacterium]